MSYSEWTKSSIAYQTYTEKLHRCTMEFTADEETRDDAGLAAMNALYRVMALRSAARRAAGPRATDAQIRRIVQLEKQRMRSGDASGFTSTKPGTSAQLRGMSYQDAKQHITSLTGNY